MNKIIVFLLFILPLVVFPFGPSPFETPKIILGFLGMEVFIIIGFLKNSVRLKNISKIQLFTYAGIFLLSVFHLTYYRNIDFFWGNVYRLQGIFLLWHLLLFSLLASLVETNFVKSRIVLVSLLVTFVSAFLINPDPSGRMLGTLGEPNFLAAFLVFLFPFLWFSQNLNVKIKSLFVLILFFLVLLTGSRSGLIALGLEIIILILVKINSRNLVLPVLVSLLLLIGSLVLPFLEQRGKWENRNQIWQTGAVAGMINPIFGSGFGNIEKPLKLASDKLGEDNWIRYQPIDSAHNIILDFWIQGGAVGVVLLILLISSSLITFLKTQNLLLLTLLFGLLTVLMFNPGSIVTLIAFWWVLGQGQNMRLTILDKSGKNG